MVFSFKNYYSRYSIVLLRSLLTLFTDTVCQIVSVSSRTHSFHGIFPDHLVCLVHGRGFEVNMKNDPLFHCNPLQLEAGIPGRILQTLSPHNLHDIPIQTERITNFINWKWKLVGILCVDYQLQIY